MNTPLSILLREKSQNIFTLASSTTIFDCVQAMIKNNIGAVLIVDNSKLVGVFTERDVLKKVAIQGLNVKETPVKEVMTSKILTVTPQTTVAEAMAIVTEKRFRHLPVVENDKLVGLISIGDLTRWVSRNQAITIRDLENYITGEHHAPHHE